jgi:threonine dehydratase
MARGRIVARGMLRQGTPIEHYPKYRLWVKREDLACPKPGPPFSKTRGVYARVLSRPEKVIGVLDTYHSQAGHAVARACQILNKKCITFYPEYKYEPGHRPPQDRAEELGAELVGLPAGRSCILFHAAKKHVEKLGGYMMPNALKLEESITETAKEVGLSPPERWHTVIIPASSGTIAAGVIKGFQESGGPVERFIVHLGYSRSEEALRKYLPEATIEVVDEGYSYKDKARPGKTPPWPCNEYYDLKAFRWWLSNMHRYSGCTLFWNIG